jgi:hypothetical protein
LTCVPCARLAKGFADLGVAQQAFARQRGNGIHARSRLQSTERAAETRARLKFLHQMRDLQGGPRACRLSVSPCAPILRRRVLVVSRRNRSYHGPRRRNSAGDEGEPPRGPVERRGSFAGLPLRHGPHREFVVEGHSYSWTGQSGRREHDRS